MPRPLRSQPSDSIFHVTARGNRRQRIFFDDVDHERFLELVSSVVNRHRWRCLAYCLMPNHYHLLIHALDENLSLGMQRLNGLFAQFFNRRRDFSGHLFQGRFHSELVESDWHILEAMRYIVLNPVRAGLCRDPDEWRWSSYRALAGGRAVDCASAGVTEIVDAFGSRPDLAAQRFEAFVADAPQTRSRDEPAT